VDFVSIQTCCDYNYYSISKPSLLNKLYATLLEELQHVYKHMPTCTVASSHADLIAAIFIYCARSACKTINQRTRCQPPPCCGHLYYCVGVRRERVS